MHTEKPLLLKRKVRNDYANQSGMSSQGTSGNYLSRSISVPSYPPSILSSLRPWTFSASVTPVILGAVLSYRVQGNVDYLLFLLTLAAVLTVNGAGNMVNSYFELARKLNSSTMTKITDFGNKVGNGKLKEKHSDNEDSRTLGADSSVGVNLTVIQVYQASLVNYAAGMYGVGMLCMLLLMNLSSAKSELIAALFFGGLSSSFVYTGGIGLKYYILGDLLVVFTFGPLSVVFSFLIQTGTLRFGPLLLALPLSLSTEAILHSKHVREMQKDKKEGVISLAVLLGIQGSYLLFAVLIFLPYLFFAVLATKNSLYLGLPLFTTPVAFSLERKLREEGPTKNISYRAALLNMAISLLFIVGSMLASNVPLIDTKN